MNIKILKVKEWKTQERLKRVIQRVSNSLRGRIYGEEEYKNRDIKS